MAIIEAVGLCKSYGKLKAVDNVDISIEENEILGLLGPNGAGKSTLVSLLLGILDADSGSIKYNGRTLKPESWGGYKKDIGFVPQDLAFFPELSAQDNVTFWGRIYGLRGAELKKAVDKALQFTGLLEYKKQKPRNFSGGMKRRLNIACGIVHSPAILFLDEPTVGVDPQSRNHILESVCELNRRGTTIVYISHYMEEVEAICERVIIMDHGHIITSGTVDALTDQISDKQIMKIEVRNPEVATAVLCTMPEVSEIETEDKNLSLTIKSDAAAHIIATLEEAAAGIVSVNMSKQNLEDVFFHYTGSHFRD